MCGCWSLALSWISRRKRSALVPSDASVLRTLMTICLFNDKSRATNTRDMPPPASSRSTRTASPRPLCNVSRSASIDPYYDRPPSGARRYSGLRRRVSGRDSVVVLLLEFLEYTVGEQLIGDGRDLFSILPCRVQRF